MAFDKRRMSRLLVILLLPLLLLHCSSAFSVNRREALGAVAFVSGVAVSSRAGAETRRPFAPTEALLPAARVKLLIEEALLAPAWNDQPPAPVVRLLLEPQNVTLGATLPEVPTQPGRIYQQSYRNVVNELPLLERPGALLAQRGEIAAWKRLKRQERLKESQNDYRAAFNLYTSSLSFTTESYLLTVSAPTRSQMIRDDRLPDVKQVIASDMGMRYLYRNQVLTALDEASAELAYQKESGNWNASEVVALIRDAQQACDLWFQLIDPVDVEAAMAVVRSELAISIGPL